MKKKTKKLLAVFFIIVCLTAIFCYWQNNALMVSCYTVCSEKLAQGLSGCRIAQISDLHSKEFGKGNKRLLKRLEQEKPDWIVITGDIVDSNHGDMAVALDFVAEAVKIAPVYYVTGNHEYWLEEKDRERLLSGIEASGAVILDDEAVLLEKDGGAFYLIGLDNRHLKDDTLKSITGNLKTGFLEVLLAHKPDNFAQYTQNGVDLVFSGHVHGGQIRLPFVGGLLDPGGGFSPKYSASMYQDRDAVMIVSRGLGNSTVPLRICNRPELVVVALEKAE